MTKQIAIINSSIYASGRNSDFPRLADSKALSIRWDGRKDVHEDFLAVEGKA